MDLTLARTMEILRSLDLADELRARGATASPNVLIVS
jgi:hypothetical protein